MGYPVFANGDVLNASDMNAVGLWLVKTQTVGNGVANVTVNGAFSSSYDNYLISVSGITSTGTNSVYMSLGGRTGNTYANGGRYFSWGGADATATSAGEAGFWLGVGGTNYSAILQLFRPFNTGPCNMSFMSSSATYGNNGNGYNNTSVSSTAFTIYPSGGTLTGGTIRVYGYRN